MPKFSIGEVAVLNHDSVNDAARRLGFVKGAYVEVVALPGQYDRCPHCGQTVAKGRPRYSCVIGGVCCGVIEEWMDKLPPDDKQDALPRWCRNLFDIEVDKPAVTGKPVNVNK